MRAIFISYRRNDAEGQAGRLFDDLTLHFGKDAVFMDVAAIQPGRDFRRAIDEQVASCGVLLAMIGKDWLTASDDAGARRLDDPLDFVRLETASALKRDIPVIPVLVQGARMPRADELPDNLKELPFATTCRSGKQAGFFSLTLADDGKSMEGWWDVCGEGRKWVWKADRR